MAADVRGYLEGGSLHAIPFNQGQPDITGSPAPGGRLACSVGTWSGEVPQTYAWQWRRNGTEIVGASLPIYAVKSTDAGSRLSCWVTATSASNGSATANSAPVSVPAPTVVSSFPPKSPSPAPSPMLFTVQPTQFRATITASAVRLRSLLRRGLLVTVSCSLRCDVDVKLKLDRRTTVRLGLARKGLTHAVIGQVTADLARRAAKQLRVPISAVAKRRLKKLAPSRIRLTVSGTELLKRPVTGAGTLTVRR
ncbi:MAG: hypothetical protein ACJ762_04170 [Solirubrobacteraceae bacterium]